MGVPNIQANQGIIMKKEQIDTGQGNKSSSIRALDLTGSLTRKYRNI